MIADQESGSPLRWPRSDARARAHARPRRQFDDRTPDQRPDKGEVRGSSRAGRSDFRERRLGRQPTSSQPSGAGPAPAKPKDNDALPPFEASDLDDPALLSGAAAELYRMRRARDRVMPSGLMGEPAWDILLALYSEEPGDLTVSSLCYGSGVPETTALRWIGVLDREGLVERSKHQRDARITLCHLEHGGARAGRTFTQRRCCAWRAREALILSRAAHRRLANGVGMNEKCVPSEQVQAMLSEIRTHLLRAQELIDSIDPNSILARAASTYHR